MTEYEKEVAEDRYGWRDLVVHRGCMVCKSHIILDIHEMETRSQAPKNWWHRCNGLLLCRDCHDSYSSADHALQLAFKLTRDPEHFDLLEWHKRRHPGARVCDRVTMRDIARYLSVSQTVAKKADHFQDCLTIVLGLPPKGLSPNDRMHHHAKAKVTKAYRQEAHIKALEAKGRSFGDPWEHAVSQETFFWPTSHRRDVRNAEAKLKAAYDGIIDAGVLRDDDVEHLTHVPTVFSWDRENPRVEIRMFQRMADS